MASAFSASIISHTIFGIGFTETKNFEPSGSEIGMHKEITSGWLRTSVLRWGLSLGRDRNLGDFTVLGFRKERKGMRD